MWWRELSDGELRARLLQRDVQPDEADYLIDHRDDCRDCQQIITELID